MGKDSSDLTALSHTVEHIGKLFSDSKARHTWTMDIDGETHVLVVTASWNSGKFVVELNGYERFSQVTKEPFVYSFKFRDRYFRVHSKGEHLVLMIDTIAFESYTAKYKANQAALLKSYKGSVSSGDSGASKKSVVHFESADEEPSAPFSGNLADRLGRSTAALPKGYVPQKDEEDMFANKAGLNVQSFVPPNQSTIAEMTVVPDLIDFSFDPQPKKPPPIVAPNSEPEDGGPLSPFPAGQVTPREKLAVPAANNPFAAFDDLVGK